MLNELSAMPQIAPQLAHFPIGSEGSREQAQSVQLLYPLAVCVVGFAPWHILDMTRVDQINLEVSRF